MKKLSILLIAVGLIFACVGCTSEVDDNSTPSSENISSQNLVSEDTKLNKTDILPIAIDDINYVNFRANVPESYNSQINADIAEFIDVVNDFEIIEDYKCSDDLDVAAVCSVELKTGEKFALRVVRDFELKTESGFEYFILHIAKFPEDATRHNLRSDIDKEVNFTAYKMDREAYGNLGDVIEKCGINSYINFGGNPPENIETPLKINLPTSKIESVSVNDSFVEVDYEINDNEKIEELVNLINDYELSQAVGQPVGQMGWAGLLLDFVVDGDKKYNICITSLPTKDIPAVLHFAEIVEDTAMTQQEKDDYNNLNYVNEFYNYVLTEEQFKELHNYILQVKTDVVVELTQDELEKIKRDNFIRNTKCEPYSLRTSLNEMDLTVYDEYFTDISTPIGYSKDFVRKIQLPCDVEYFLAKSDDKPVKTLKAGTVVFVNPATDDNKNIFGYGFDCWPDYSEEWRYGKAFLTDDFETDLANEKSYYIKYEQLKKVATVYYEENKKFIGDLTQEEVLRNYTQTCDSVLYSYGCFSSDVYYPEFFG